MSRIAVDFDGTMVTRAWPGMGEWFDGCVDVLRELHDHGHHVFLYTARLSGSWPDGSPRTPSDVMRDTLEVRAKLDDAGLTFMDIWTGDGKPHWDLLIDDKALWFPGRKGSWRKLLPVILARVGDEDSYATVMQEADRRSEEE